MSAGDDLIEHIQNYGPAINMSIMYNDMLMTTCPEHIKLVLATDFQNFVKGKIYHMSQSIPPDHVM